MTGLDHGAVDQAARDRPDLAGRDRRQHLVQDGQAARPVATAYQGLALPVPGECHQVGLGEALADLGCLLEDRVRRGRPALEERREAGRQHQEAALGAVDTGVGDQALGPGDPPATAGHLATQQQGQ